jgi:hypothetical protein
MPKRIVDGEGIWKSDKLAALDDMTRAEYANLIPLADANGVFHCDAYKIWSQVYSYNRAQYDPETIDSILHELAAGGMLFRWRDESDKVWGYFVGIEKPGRLPGASRRGFNDYANGVLPDPEEVKKYVAKCRSTGLVYFIQGKCTGRIKIGISKSPRRRISMHQVGSPEELVLLAVTTGGREMEKALHQRFSGSRVHGEWFECTEELKSFISSCASMDSPEFDDGIPNLLGVGVGLGSGIGLGQVEENEADVSLKQNIMDKSREIFGVRIFPGDANWGEIKSLARIYGNDKVLERFEQWAKTEVAPPTYPLTAFIRVADSLLKGYWYGSYPSAELSTLLNEMSGFADGRVVFNSMQRGAIQRLVQEYSPEEVKTAFKEYFSNIENDDYLAPRAAKTFTEVAGQLISVKRRRKDEARKTQETIRTLTEQERKKAEAELAEKLAEEAREQESVEEHLPMG